MKKRLKKKLNKKNMTISKKIFLNKKFIDSFPVLDIVDGKVQLDFNNPKHIEIHKKWMED